MLPDTPRQNDSSEKGLIYEIYEILQEQHSVERFECRVKSQRGRLHINRMKQAQSSYIFPGKRWHESGRLTSLPELDTFLLQRLKSWAPFILWVLKIYLFFLSFLSKDPNQSNDARSSVCAVHEVGSRLARRCASCFKINNKQINIFFPKIQAISQIQHRDFHGFPCVIIHCWWLVRGYKTNFSK